MGKEDVNQPMSIVNDKPTPETDAFMTRIRGIDGDKHWVPADTAKRLERERDEAREENKNLKLQLELWEDGNLICEGTLGEIRLLEERIEEAQKELSSIHRWIDKNHADGFIDSLTYLQNLERVTDSWYDRIDGIEADARKFVRERDEALESLKHITEYGTEEINAAVELRQKLASALVERDDLQKAVNGLCEHLGVSPANTTLLAVEVLRIQREREEAITRRMETIMQCELYEQERDEAREALKYIAHSGLSARHIEDYAKDFLSKK